MDILKICGGIIILAMAAIYTLNRYWPKIWTRIFRNGDDTYNPSL